MSARVERTIETLLSHGFTVTAKCNVCGGYREIDLRNALDKLGRNFTFWNRRSTCTFKRLCPGWVHFHVGPGLGHVAADEITAAKWSFAEGEERRLWDAAMNAAAKNGGRLVVSQIDRGGAASYLFNEGQGAVGDLIDKGKQDHHLLVQAFARHALLTRIRRGRGD